MAVMIRPLILPISPRSDIPKVILYRFSASERRNGGTLFHTLRLEGSEECELPGSCEFLIFPVIHPVATQSHSPSTRSQGISLFSTPRKGKLSTGCGEFCEWFRHFHTFHSFHRLWINLCTTFAISTSVPFFLHNYCKLQLFSNIPGKFSVNYNFVIIHSVDKSCG